MLRAMLRAWTIVPLLYHARCIWTIVSEIKHILTYLLECILKQEVTQKHLDQYGRVGFSEVGPKFCKCIGQMGRTIIACINNYMQAWNLKFHIPNNLQKISIFTIFYFLISTFNILIHNKHKYIPFWVETISTGRNIINAIINTMVVHISSSTINASTRRIDMLVASTQSTVNVMATSGMLSSDQDPIGMISIVSKFI